MGALRVVCSSSLAHSQSELASIVDSHSPTNHKQSTNIHIHTWVNQLIIFIVIPKDMYVTWRQ